MNKAVIGIFSFVDDTIKAIEGLRRAGIKGFEIFSPIPSHDIEHVLEEGREKSILNFSLNSIITAIKNRDFQVMRISAAGSLGVMFFLIGLAIATFLLYPIQGGGLPIIPIPALILVGGVGAALGGVIFAVVGFLFLSRLPNLDLGVYDSSVSIDKFAIILKNSNSEEQAIAKDIFKKCGADQVKEEESN